MTSSSPPGCRSGSAQSWDGATLGLGEGRWLDVLTGETVEGGEKQVADLLARFPVALLFRG